MASPEQQGCEKLCDPTAEDAKQKGYGGKQEHGDGHEGGCLTDGIGQKRGILPREEGAHRDRQGIHGGKECGKEQNADANDGKGISRADCGG